MATIDLPTGRNRIGSSLLLLLGLLIASCFAGNANAQSRSLYAAESEKQDASNPEDRMLDMLKDRVIENPQQAETWRLIGRLEKKRGNFKEAVEATGQSISLDPLNAAAHYDFAELLVLAKQFDAAARHQQKVFALAPESNYAAQLIESGVNPDKNAISNIATVIDDEWKVEISASHADGSSAVDGQVSQVDYTVQSFDGSRNLEDGIQELENLESGFKPYRFFVESGALYNTNISLTPISRDLARSDAASAQGYAAPEFEWTIRKNSDSRFGILNKGFFTVNESQWSAFNLASFQPGSFFEKEFKHNDNLYIGRVDYTYSLDIVGGNRLGDRHSIMGSMIKIRPDLDVIYAYLTVGMSQFDDDGADPSINSLDGTSVTGGISRFFRTGMARMPTFTLGIDIQTANTEGANARYSGVTAHTSTTINLNDRLSFLPDAGIGGRNYYDFTGAVDRDELTWRIGGKLQWQWNDRSTIALVAGHNRFASDNSEFDAKRTQLGIVTTITY